MNNLLKVVVTQAEGLVSDMDKPFVFEGSDCIERAEGKLRQIAVNGPDLGYYKTDVEVTLMDGTELRLRMDVGKIGSPNNDLDIIAHLRRFLEAYSGRVVPAQYRNKYTQEQWLNLMCNRHGSEATMNLSRALDVLNG